MVTKNELKQYYWTKRRIQQLENKILELESEAERQTAQIGRVPGPSGNVKGHVKDRMAEIVAKIVELKDKLNNEIASSYESLAKITEAIKGLPSRERYLIHARYIECKKWEQIAVEMNYSWQHIHEIHAKALKKLDPKKTE
jgi:RNA polymerase sigma factor (sigma-70 family)